MSRKIEDCIERLESFWPALQMGFTRKWPGWEAILTCTYRSPQEQFELFKKGRILEGNAWAVKTGHEVVTNCDGIKKLSMHNYFPSRAFDIALIGPDNKMFWDYKAPQWQLGQFLIPGITWGGNWTKFPDFPHFEV